MSKTRKNARGGHQRKLSVRAIRRRPVDVRKLGRALMELAMSQAAAEADAQQQAEQADGHVTAIDPSNDKQALVEKSDENARE